MGVTASEFEQHIGHGRRTSMIIKGGIKNESWVTAGQKVTSISQGNVTTHLRCGGGLYWRHVTDFLLLSLHGNELWQSVTICQSYGEKY